MESWWLLAGLLLLTGFSIGGNSSGYPYYLEMPKNETPEERRKRRRDKYAKRMEELGEEFKRLGEEAKRLELDEEYHGRKETLDNEHAKRKGQLEAEYKTKITELRKEVYGAR